MLRLWALMLVNAMMMTMRIAAGPATTSPVVRTDARVSSAPGIEIFIREVRPAAPAGGVPIVLVHGGGPDGLASFDLISADAHPFNG